MSLHKMLRAAAGYQAPAPANTDPQFNYVSMLLHGDGTNGSQNNTFVDSSTNNFTITRNGNTTQGSLSPYGDLWSNYFSSSSTDFLSFPSNTATNFSNSNFTFECWFFKEADPPQSTNLIWWNGASNNSSQSGLRLQLEPSRIITLLCSENGSSWQVNTSSTAQYSNYVWNHIAVVRNGQTVTVYLNGVSVCSGSLSSSTASLYAGTLNYINNMAYTSGTWKMVGYVSNLRLVKGTALYTSNFTPPTAPLTAITNTALLTCQSNRFIDNSANNFTITRNGNVRVTKESPFLPTAAYSTSTIGGSGYFDGTGDYLSVPASSNLQFGSSDFCIEGWIMPNATTGGAILSNTDSWQSGRYNLTCGQLSNTELYFYANSINGGTPVLSSSSLAVRAWSHFVVCRSGSSWAMFINGVRVSTYTSSGSFSDPSTLTTRVGATDNGSAQPFNGWLSDMRVVIGASVYSPSSTTLTVPTAPLTAITNTRLLLNFTNAGIFDNAAENDLETVGNTQVSTSVKKFGSGSTSFNGSASTYLLTQSSSQIEFGSGNFTIEMWINFTTAPSSSVEYQLWQPVNHASGFKRLSILIYASSIGIGYFGTNAAVTSALSWTTGQWYHLAFVRNGNTWTIYRDGTSVASGTDTSTLDVASGYYTGPRINGYIDDLRITKGVARYTANFTPPTAAFPDQ